MHILKKLTSSLNRIKNMRVFSVDYTQSKIKCFIIVCLICKLNTGKVPQAITWHFCVFMLMLYANAQIFLSFRGYSWVKPVISKLSIKCFTQGYGSILASRAFQH